MKDTEDPKCSVVMPMFNCSSTVLRSAQSVLNQTFQDIELLLVDDCSTDDTLKIAAVLTDEDSRVRLLSTDTNSGAGVARNVGIDQSRGRFIAFIDSDDEWLAAKLEKQISFMLTSGAAISHTSYERVHTSGNGRSVTVHAPAYVDSKGLRFTNPIGMSTAVVDSVAVGSFHVPDIRLRQDYALWISLAKDGFTVYGIDEVLVRYNVRGDSLSSNKRRALSYTYRVYREVAGLGPLAAGVRLVRNAANALRKRI